MALLAEQLVDEWLGRQGFFTLRGVKEGVQEIDLLGVSLVNGEIEAWHVEVQVSFRPISYLGKLSKQDQIATGAKNANSAKSKTPALIESGAKDWVQRKFRSDKKVATRNKCWKNLCWKEKFVHGRMKDKTELEYVSNCGVELIPFSTVLSDLCAYRAGEMFSAAGTDIAEMIRYYKETS